VKSEYVVPSAEGKMLTLTSLKVQQMETRNFFLLIGWPIFGYARAHVAYHVAPSLGDHTGLAEELPVDSDNL
jgi:hypothetical protein